MQLINPKLTYPSYLRASSILLIIVYASMSSSYAENTYKISTVSTVRTILEDISNIRLSREELVPSEEMPFICVTYAQTLDGSIAMKKNDFETSSNLKLSSDDSFLLTHALRSQFDGIIIGGNTLKTDNPRLNNRLWAENWHEFEVGKVVLKSTARELKQPIPIILDTNLRCILEMIDSAGVINAAISHPLVIVCCSQESYNEHHKRIETYCEYNNFSIELLPCACNDSSTGLDLEDVVYNLCMVHGVYSIMVEGGASILSGFLSKKDLLDCVCVTICPRMVGLRGLNALGAADIGGKSNQESNMLEFDNNSWFTLGSDCIFLAS
jgi:riboflavin-specific deaminase-like protein